ncbi:hypothetical protein BJ138DRAFT_1148262, partial [Hygrophoropsis aurantiaca]
MTLRLRVICLCLALCIAQAAAKCYMSLYPEENYGGVPYEYVGDGEADCVKIDKGSSVKIHSFHFTASKSHKLTLWGGAGCSKSKDWLGESVGSWSVDKMSKNATKLSSFSVFYYL